MNKTEKLLAKLPAAQRNAILQALLLLADGHLDSLDIKSLKGHKNIYRIRVGNYRIIFSSQQSDIRVITILKRDDKTYHDF